MTEPGTIYPGLFLICKKTFIACQVTLVNVSYLVSERVLPRGSTYFTPLVNVSYPVGQRVLPS